MNEPYFRRKLGEVRLTWPDAPEEPALRAAQLGAILSLAGHLQTSDEAAQAVLPTGVGKTAVMCALPFLLPTTRVLVVVPTRLLRDQIAREFEELATLKAVGAVSAESELPSVRRVEHRLRSAEAWTELEAYDVAVGTPGVLSSLHEGVAEPPGGLFDLLVFDEAHHLPATTWQGIYEKHRQRSALLTATPFRRDRKRLPGSAVYHYSLRRAIADGVYAPVTFIPVDAMPIDDQAIAAAAVDRLRSPEHQGEGSLLLVRTDRVEHAKKLVDVYAQLGTTIGIITEQQSGRTVRRTVDKLRNGELEGVASVGALVEGFDLPKLKIAAYHRPHKTLPPTLQFVGRISRITGGEAPAELVAVREAVRAETAELYREDAAWEQLLPELADTAVQRERDTRRYLSDSEVTGPEDLSPAALAPQRMVQVFDTTPCPDINLRAEFRYLPHGRVVFRFVDPEGVLLAVVTERRMRPIWIESDALDTYEYHLMMAVYVPAHNLLYVSAPSVSATSHVRSNIEAADAEQIAPQLVARYLWAARVASYSSVGMSNTRAAARQAAYRMLAGSGVEAAVSLAEVRGYGLGHLIGRREVDGRLTGMGISVKKSKIWETAPCDSLLQFREWCDELSVAIRTEVPIQTEQVPHLQLRLPVQLHRFPDRPIAAFLDERLVRGDNHLIVDQEFIDLGSLQLLCDKVAEDRLRLSLAFDDGEVWAGSLGTTGEVTPEGVERYVRTSFGGLERFAELLRDLPPRIYFANGSSSSGVVLYEPMAALAELPEEVFVVWEWGNTDIRREYGDTEGQLLNVQDRARAFITATFNDPVVLIDHGSYEIADIVAIEQGPDENTVHFFHCKASGDAAPGRRLDDLYEVLGQGIRSARWSSPRALWRELERRVQARPNLEVVGQERAEVAGLLSAWRVDPPEVRLCVWIVQPGISRGGVNGWLEGQALIANVYEWCSDMPATLRLAISP